MFEGRGRKAGARYSNIFFLSDHHLHFPTSYMWFVWKHLIGEGKTGELGQCKSISCMDRIFLSATLHVNSISSLCMQCVINLKMYEMAESDHFAQLLNDRKRKFFTHIDLGLYKSLILLLTFGSWIISFSKKASFQWWGGSLCIVNCLLSKMHDWSA